jgi:transcriptional regulator with XRE-family HTH domain
MQLEHIETATEHDEPQPRRREVTDVDLHVGRRVRLIRLSKKMSQESLGDHLGVTFQQVQKYEKGVNRISVGRLYRLATIFGVPIGAFFQGLDTAPEDTPDPLHGITAAVDLDLLRIYAHLPPVLRAALLTVARAMEAQRG